MFIFTAKLDKKRALFIVIAAAVVLAAIVLFAGSKSEAATTESSLSIQTNEDRISFLASYGWKVSETPVEEQEIVIPRKFDGIYADYIALQDAQGFELADYGGFDAMRYTYAVLNYPGGDEGVLADIIVYRGRVIAGDIQSAALDGFMHGLQYPES